jgi:hypothetical protein
LNDVMKLLGKQVCVELSEKQSFKGVLSDLGSDILILFTKKQFLYIPWIHVHRIYESTSIDEPVNNIGEPTLAEGMESISFRKILLNAKAMFAEIYVTGDLSFHGYITSVLSDYFVFYSPVYKTMFIPLYHLKWLNLYNQDMTPYTLTSESLPVNPTKVPLQRSLEEQLKKSEGKLVVFNGGSDPMEIGLLKKVENNLVQLVMATGELVYLKLHHIKSVHFP